MGAMLSGILVVLVVFAFSTTGVVAAETIRVGVLKFGTVNWELNAMKAGAFDAKNGVNVEIVGFAGEDATAVALRAGDVDIIVSDWLDVSRARASGDDLTFVPYSSSTGAIMVPGDSSIGSLRDLKARKIGIAGGPLDKNWLLIQALVKRDYGADLAAENEIIFGAPPLLMEKAKQGEMDAVLNFWYYCARLEASGFRRLVSGADAASALGAAGAVSALGYVFHEEWADEHPDAIMGFIKASRDTKTLLKQSDGEWDRLHADGAIQDQGAALLKLRERYREGIPNRPADQEAADAAKLYGVLAELGGKKLAGNSTSMAPGTYWSKLPNDF